MKLLLWRGDVNPDTLDTVLDKIPLLRVAGVVKPLLAWEAVSPNSSSKSSGTPPTLATTNRCFRIVQRLHARNSRSIR